MTRTLFLALTLSIPIGMAQAQSYSCSSPNTLQTFTNNSAAGTATGPIQSFTVPASQVTIDALGAQGGLGNNGGGKGAEVVATVPVTPGQTLCVAVGTQGGSAGNGAGGGGGGSFVYAITSGTCASNLAAVTTGSSPQLLVAAGGGGGSGIFTQGLNGIAPSGAGLPGASNGGNGDQGGGLGGSGGSGGGAIINSGGGAGLFTGGASAGGPPGGTALIGGGAGGVYSAYANGGFGGGGAAAAPGGGGGGYNGGGAGGFSVSALGGGGGGSFSATTPLSPYTQSGVRTGNGLVTLCYTASGPATHFSISAPSPVTSYISNQLTVTALDAGGNTATGYTGTVHLTSTDPGFVNGTGDATLTNGAGTFNFALKQAGTQTITATDTVNSSITGTSSGITVLPGPAARFTVSAPASVNAGSHFNFTVTAADLYGNAATGYEGTVHFSSTDPAATLPADIIVNGAVTLQATLNTTGQQTLTATDTQSAITGTSGTITVIGNTSTALIAAPNSTVYGQSATFTATVTSNGSPVTAGSVTLRDLTSGATLTSNAALNAVGQAAMTLSTLAAGGHNIQATYNPDSYHSSSSNALSFTVNQAATGAALVSAPNPSTFGQFVTFTATVTAAAPGSGTPTGSVTFKDGSASLGSATLTNGTAAFSTSTLSAASHTITAVYSGDSNFSGSTSSPLTQTVSSTSQTITFAALPSVTYGAAPFVLTATATSGLAVSFASNTPAACAVSGTAVTIVGAGACSITATQPGNSSYTAAAPVTQTFTVNQAVLTVTANNATSAIGWPLPAFSATMTGFVNGDTAAAVTGAPTFTTTATPNSTPGNYPIVPAPGTLAAANYSFTFASGTLVLTAQPTIVINTGGTTPGAGGSYYGESFTTPAGGPWTNISFSFFSDQGVTPAAAGTAYLFTTPYTGTPAGLASSGSNAQSMARTGSAGPRAAAGFLAASTGISGGAYVFPASVVLQPGTQYFVYESAPESSFPGAILTGGTLGGASLYVATGASAAFAPAAGAANFRVAGSLVPPASSITLTASPNPATLGQTVTFTATVSGNLAAVAIGAVQFLDGSAVLGTVPLTNGQAVFRTPALAAGSHVITASYQGGGAYPPAQATAAETVNPLASSLALAANAPAPVYGQPVILTATVGASSPPAGFAAPTGQVSFYALGAGPAGPRTLLGAAPLASGSASYTLTNLPTGPQYYLAQYSGDSTWSASVAQIAIAVSSASSAASVSMAVVGGKLTLSAAVLAVPPGAGTPTGSIRFVDTANQNVVASATLTNGAASGAVAAGAAATVLARPIAVVYSGDPNFKSSTSAPLPAVTSAAADLWSAFAGDEIVSLFGVTGLSGDTAATLPLAASLAGVSANVTDSAGAVRPALLYGVFASAAQVNLILPAGAATGMASIGLTLPGGAVAGTVVNIAASAPAIFTANANGQGVFAGQVLYVNADGSQTIANPAIWQPAAGAYMPNPISVTGGQVYLVLYGTGIRHAAAVTAALNGVNVPVVYFGPQGTYPGLDQINLGPLPAGLAGAGTVALSIAADGQAANAVAVAIQ